MIKFGSSFLKIRESFTTYSGPIVPPEPEIYQWFLLEIDAIQGGDRTLSLGEFRFIDSQGHQVGTYTASSWTRGYVNPSVGEQSAEYLFDGIIDDPYLKYCLREDSDIFVIFYAADFPAFAGLRYQLCTAADSTDWPGCNPGTWRLYTSPQELPRDSSRWTLIDQRMNDTTMRDVDSTWYTFNLQNI